MKISNQLRHALKNCFLLSRVHSALYRRRIFEIFSSHIQGTCTKLGPCTRCMQRARLATTTSSGINRVYFYSVLTGVIRLISMLRIAHSLARDSLSRNREHEKIRIEGREGKHPSGAMANEGTTEPSTGREPIRVMLQRSRSECERRRN